MNAGIAMKDFLVATTAGLIQNVAVVDLIYQEEKKQNCEFVAAYLQKAQRIAYINLNCNKISFKEFEKLMEISVESCETMAQEMRHAVKRHIFDNKNCFYLN
jgi:exosome complex component RRP41